MPQSHSAQVVSSQQFEWRSTYPVQGTLHFHSHHGKGRKRGCVTYKYGNDKWLNIQCKSIWTKQWAMWTIFSRYPGTAGAGSSIQQIPSLKSDMYKGYAQLTLIWLFFQDQIRYMDCQWLGGQHLRHTLGDLQSTVTPC